MALQMYFRWELPKQGSPLHAPKYEIPIVGTPPRTGPLISGNCHIHPFPTSAQQRALPVLAILMSQTLNRPKPFSGGSKGGMKVTWVKGSLVYTLLYRGLLPVPLLPSFHPLSPLGIPVILPFCGCRKFFTIWEASKEAYILPHSIDFRL